jgi:putative addiction module component (TIGR02574 family)
MPTLDISRLSPKERLDLIGELWDSLAAEEVQLTPAQERELEHRISTFDDDAGTAIPCESLDREFTEQFLVGAHQTRRTLLQRFPYVLIFREVEEDCYVVAVFHVSRDPTAWRRRME